ncbi:MAG: 16S rRNA (guanine(966)-N(2))-methyltransferase RsmD [Selenomonadaceae bacterium]|nr:16S rRNA (guanine(966)-N(2))-methyltransferase RsmD [Selenomonadaceae bacterium]
MRIITGRAKGLRLKTPAGFSTRPTSDRVKESLFSILGGLIDFVEINAVLDIFAGTGALGLEAISRGAHSATFIDMATTEIIRDNVTRAKFLNECKILRGDFEKILLRLARQSMTFDLIFSDPPYAKGLAQSSINLVAELNLLSAGGLIIVEHGAEEILQSPINFNLVRTTTYGHTTAIEIFFRELTS